MPLCPFATVRLLGRPQPPTALQPTQIIVHTANSTLPAADVRFRRRGARGWSHFGVSSAGKIIQWLDTATPADAAYRANHRSDGTGALSVTTEGHVSESWTEAQLDALVRLHWWLMRVHPAIARRACRAAADPGLGHHVLLGSPGPWTPIAKSCPGPRRVEQWQNSLLPQVLAPYGVDPSDMRPRHEIAEEIVRDLLATPVLAATSVAPAETDAESAPPIPPSPTDPPATPAPPTASVAATGSAPQHHPVRDALLDFFLPDSAPHGPQD